MSVTTLDTEILGTAGHAIRVVLRFLGPVFLGLTVLAVRGRVKHDSICEAKVSWYRKCGSLSGVVGGECFLFVLGCGQAAVRPREVSFVAVVLGGAPCFGFDLDLPLGVE